MQVFPTNSEGTRNYTPKTPPLKDPSAAVFISGFSTSTNSSPTPILRHYLTISHPHTLSLPNSSGASPGKAVAARMLRMLSGIIRSSGFIKGTGSQ